MSAARAAAVLLLALAAGCNGDETLIARPNVLIVTLDTLRADRLGCYGGARETSPRLDAFARQSVLFEEAFATSSFTPPTHASLLTSRWPAEHGLTHWNKALAKEVPTAAELFALAGYRTGAFTPMRTLLVLGLQRGFQTMESPPYRMNGDKAILADADAVNADALAWLTDPPPEQADKPFFAWVHYYDAHRPYGRQGPEWSGKFTAHDDPAIGATEDWYQVSPKERVELGLDAGRVALMEDHYDGGLAYLDGRVGRLLDGLAEAGLLENTIVVLIGDHGEVFDEFEPEWFAHDPYLVEENVHVPFLLRLPRDEHAGLRVKALVSQVDVLPTLLELAQVSPPVHAPLSGLNLQPLLRGGRPPRELVFADRIGDDLSDRKLAKPPDEAAVRASRDHQRSVRSATRKLVNFEDRGTFELWAVDGSAPEGVDLSSREPAARKGLLTAYLQWRQGLRLPGATTEGDLSAEDLELLYGLGYISGDAPAPVEPPADPAAEPPAKPGDEPGGADSGHGKGPPGQAVHPPPAPGEKP